MLLTFKWLEIRDAAKHPTMCRTALPLTTKNYIAQNVNSAKAKKLYSSWRSQGRLPGGGDTRTVFLKITNSSPGRQGKERAFLTKNVKFAKVQRPEIAPHV